MSLDQYIQVEQEFDAGDVIVNDFFSNAYAIPNTAKGYILLDRVDLLEDMVSKSVHGVYTCPIDLSKPNITHIHDVLTYDEFCKKRTNPKIPFARSYHHISDMQSDLYSLAHGCANGCFYKIKSTNDIGHLFEILQQ